MNKIINKHRDLLVCIILVIAILAIFWQIKNHDFINYDDNVYVTDNLHIYQGLTVDNIIWAFTTGYASNYHPLTWLSHMLDISLFGLNPGWHHLVNVFFHIANTLLLFFILNRMTGAFWRSIFVSALFAFHPLHVESVAWAAERKDVLSTFFFMLTILAYILYVEKPLLRRYLLVLFLFILGLLSKPMLVTLPFVLLLLDYWPLSRFELKAKIPFHLIWEKIPLFILVAISSIVTFFVQQSGGAVKSLELFSLKVRIANALVSYADYIGKMIYPLNLAVLYPHPGSNLPLWQVLVAVFLLLFISVFVIWKIKKLPYLFVGWFWYIGMLFPVIGLVQIGGQSMADRYTYISLIGLFIMISWGVPDILKKWHYQRLFLSVSTGIILSALMILTWIQLGYWKDSLILYEHALKVTSNNDLAHNNLGVALAKLKKKYDEAISHYYKALQIRPNHVKAHTNIGVALGEKGMYKEAIPHYYKALRIYPDYAYAHNNLGFALAKLGRFREAIVHFKEALRINPEDLDAYNNMGNALSHLRRYEEAIPYYYKALRIKPDYFEAHNNLGAALFRQGKVNEAISHFREALRINPNNEKTHENLGVALGQQGRIDEAIFHFQEALRIKPDFAEAHNNLGVALAQQGKIKEAIFHFQEALRINPDYIEAHSNLQAVIKMQNKY